MVDILRRGRNTNHDHIKEFLGGNSKSIEEVVLEQSESVGEADPELREYVESQHQNQEDNYQEK